MCICNTHNRSSSAFYFPMPKLRSRRFRVRIHGINRINKCDKEKIEQDLELSNLKLYMENMSILKENEKLRKKAIVLHQENLVLLSEFEKKFP